VEISKYNQVLAITHSPQVAAKADKHWKIIKNIKDSNLMESSIIELNEEQRIEEIANIFLEIIFQKQVKSCKRFAFKKVINKNLITKFKDIQSKILKLDKIILSGFKI